MLFTRSGGLFAAALMSTLLSLSHAHSDVLNIHGSGTTNPSKCFWAIMEDFEDQSLHPMRMTYRAVGSTTGIAEFSTNNVVNTTEYTRPAADFGSGDLPLPADTYNAMNAAGIGVLQLPVLLGAVSFFYNIPNLQVLDLDACLLARIFNREIKVWGHEDLVAKNPRLAEPQFVDLEITVARRVRGSSSTDSITNYLHDACPDHWPIEMVGAVIDWPTDTEPCEGSGGVTTCITQTRGTIGYLDAGHGISEGLAEIALTNDAGMTQTSAKASERGGIAAAEPETFPAANADFSSISLLNRPGTYTWPIVLMTYVYVRQDLSHLEDPDEQSLLKAWLQALYNDDYIQQCVDDYGFTLPTEATRQYALDAIETLIITPEANEWIFESSTQPIVAADTFVISQKRRTHNEVERDLLMDKVAALEQANAELELNLQRVEEDNFDKDGMLTAALVIGLFAMVLSLLAVGCVLCGMVGTHKP